MLHDDRRTGDYLAALAAAVRPGDVVLDIGTGSGVLAVAAARAGARRVYAVEASDIAEVAERVFAANGVTDTVTLVPGWSRQIELPEPADLLVAEIIGNEPLEEEILETTLDARRRLLKPDARLIPHTLTLLARPLRLPDGEARQRAIGRAAVERWRGLYDMEFQPLLDAALPGPVNMPTEAEVVAAWPPVGPPVTLAALDLATFTDASVRASRRPRRRRAGHGERRRRHVPRRPPRDDRAHPRSLDVADLELGDVGVGAPRPAATSGRGRAAGALPPPGAGSARRAHLRARREMAMSVGHPLRMMPRPLMTILGVTVRCSKIVHETRGRLQWEWCVGEHAAGRRWSPVEPRTRPAGTRGQQQDDYDEGTSRTSAAGAAASRPDRGGQRGRRDPAPGRAARRPARSPTRSSRPPRPRPSASRHAILRKEEWSWLGWSCRRAGARPRGLLQRARSTPCRSCSPTT